MTLTDFAQTLKRDFFGVPPTMFRYIFLCAAFLGAAGCQSRQLSQTATSFTTAVDLITRQQIVENLARFADSNAASVTQLRLKSGKVAVSNSISPSVSVPIGRGVNRGLVLSDPSNRVTITPPGVTLAAQIAFDLELTVEPVNDPIMLRNLEYVYRRVIEQSEDWEVLFPDRAKVVSDRYDPSWFNAVSIAQRRFNDSPGPSPIDETRAGYCVFCATDSAERQRSVESPTLTLAPTFQERWLRIERYSSSFSESLLGLHKDKELSAGYDLIGAAGRYRFYVRKEHAHRFTQFSLAVSAIISAQR